MNLNNEQYKDQWNVTIAALLHDIGKMRQRSVHSLSTETKNLDGIINPINSHWHALHTHEFIDDNRSVFPGDVDVEVILNLASKHHMHVHDTPEEVIISEADWISSGADRDKREYEKTGQYYEVSLRSVFDKINQSSIKGQPSKINTYKLGTSVPGYMYPEQKDIKLTRDGYTDLWDNFEKDFKKLIGLSAEKFVYGLIAIMQRYTWCVPASTTDEPDVSLYDHSVTTAAFAVSLWIYHKETNTMKAEEIRNKDKKRLCLLGGNLSGIQKYIFNLRKERVKGGSRLLRARSFEIQMLGEASARYITDGLGMTPIQNIMNAGGRFLLVAPNLPRINEQYNMVATDIEQWCFGKYLGQLSVIMATPVAVSRDDFRQDKFSKTYELIENAGINAKQKRHQRHLLTGNDWDVSRAIISDDYDLFKTRNTCSACGVMPTQEEGVALCHACNGLTELGRDLPYADRYVWTRNDPSGSGVSNLNFFDNNICISVVRKDRKDPRDSFLVEKVDAYEPGKGYRQSAQHLPSESGKPLTFEDLAEKALNGKKGVPHLAMLKADVDNMGKIFREGLEARFSVSRYATMSRMLDAFFSKCLHELLETESPNVYTVFAGGDDVCLIGPWNAIFDLAPKIDQKFKQFMGYNHNITISTGIILAHQGLPVPLMADYAESALAKAKQYPGKNCANVFEINIGWDKWDTVSDWIKFFNEGLEDYEANEKNGFSKGVVRSLLSLRKFALPPAGNKHKKDSIPWRAHLKYMLGRNVNDENKRIHIEKLAAFGNESEHEWKLLKVPLTYVIYNNRKVGDRK